MPGFHMDIYTHLHEHRYTHTSHYIHTTHIPYSPPPLRKRERVGGERDFGKFGKFMLTLIFVRPRMRT